MALFFRTVPGISLLGIVALLALMANPSTRDWAMILLAPLSAGILVHVFLIGLLVEAWRGRLPRALAIVPLAAYGGYYALYAMQAAEIARKAAELRKENSGKIFAFDPELHSLVTAGASRLVREHAIPVAYEASKNFPEGYNSYRLIRGDQCRAIPRDSRNRIMTYGVHAGEKLLSTCELVFPETPPKKTITAVKHGKAEVWNAEANIGEQLTEMVVDDTVVGRFRIASVGRLLAVPVMIIACGGQDGCGAAFMRWPLSLDTVPDGVDRTRYDTPESIMLGIPRYSGQELVNFQGYKQNDEALVRVAGEPKRVEDDTFAILKQFIDGKDPTIPYNMGVSLAQDPERLGPFAKAMAARFLELVQRKPGAGRGRSDQMIGPLQTAIAALPAASFAEIADDVFDFVKNSDKSWERFPALYVRAADAGPKTLEFYQSHFMSEKIKGYRAVLPVLAMCRMGQASAEALTRMKEQFVSNATNEDNFKSALFVTLIKLGEEPFVRENRKKLSVVAQDWANAVLSGTGRTVVGPNNCMAREWGETSYVGGAMAPSLAWNGQRSVQRKT